MDKFSGKWTGNNEKEGETVRLVYCHDCKHKERKCFPNGVCYGVFCKKLGIEIKPYFFCRYGEEKNKKGNEK